MCTALAASITRLTASIGAELHGVDLRSGTDSTVIGLIRAAVAEHHVIVIRDQLLSAGQHAAIAESFGPILTSAVQIATGMSDTAPGAISTIEDPPYGGDTIWASTAAIFDALSPVDQAHCARATILHAPGEQLLPSLARHHGTAGADHLQREHPGHVHPLVGYPQRRVRRRCVTSA